MELFPEATGPSIAITEANRGSEEPGGDGVSELTQGDYKGQGTWNKEQEEQLHGTNSQVAT